VTSLDQPSHSTDLAAADFCLLPQLKLVLMGLCFCDAIDFIKISPDDLKRISQSGLLNISKTFTVVSRSVYL